MTYVPVDLLEELLARLPVKSLGKFKSVSKEWKSLLESKRFVERHLSLGKSAAKILAAHNCDCGVWPSLLRESRFEWGEEFVLLHCDVTRQSMSCEGLVCIPEAGLVNILNPSTGQLWRLSYPPSILNRRNNNNFINGAMGFGRDSVNGSYKLVRIRSKNCDILDVNTGKWRKLWKPNRYKVDVGRKSACVNGSIYWLRIVRIGLIFTILALDLHTKEFHYVHRPPLPNGIMFEEAQIVNLDDRLAIAMPQKPNNGIGEWALEIWSMDAQEETWSKTHSISLASLSIKPGESRSFTPVTNVVFHDDNKRLFKYYPETNQLHSFSPDICVISPYIETLVSLQTTQQVELRIGVTCIRGKTLTDLGTWLWKNKIKSLATFLLAYCLSRYFYLWTVCYAAGLIILSWLVRYAYLDKKIIKARIIMMRQNTNVQLSVRSIVTWPWRNRLVMICLFLSRTTFSPYLSYGAALYFFYRLSGSRIKLTLILMFMYVSAEKKAEHLVMISYTFGITPKHMLWAFIHYYVDEILLLVGVILIVGFLQIYTLLVGFTLGFEW